MEQSKIKSLVIKNNPNAPKDKKRAIAFFLMDNGQTIKRKFGYFGSKGTYFDGASEEKRNAYIARHKVREDFNDVFSAGSLSRWVLWEFRSRNEIEKFYNRKFKIPKVKVQITKQKLE
jgi:hypothetical protein